LTTFDESSVESPRTIFAGFVSARRIRDPLKPQVSEFENMETVNAPGGSVLAIYLSYRVTKVRAFAGAKRRRKYG
jgi:hypothetical protein